MLQCRETPIIIGRHIEQGRGRRKTEASRAVIDQRWYDAEFDDDFRIFVGLLGRFLVGYPADIYAGFRCDGSGWWLPESL